MAIGTDLFNQNLFSNWNKDQGVGDLFNDEEQYTDPSNGYQSFRLPEAENALGANEVANTLNYASQGRLNLDTGQYDKEPLGLQLARVYSEAYKTPEQAFGKERDAKMPGWDNPDNWGKTYDPQSGQWKAQVPTPNYNPQNTASWAPGYIASLSKSGHQAGSHDAKYYEDKLPDWRSRTWSSGPPGSSYSEAAFGKSTTPVNRGFGSIPLGSYPSSQSSMTAPRTLAQREQVAMSPMNMGGGYSSTPRRQQQGSSQYPSYSSRINRYSALGRR